jgi:hypothetical protein
MKLIIEIYKDRKGEWRWRAKAKNGRIVADSAEGYTRKHGCECALWGFALALKDDLGSTEGPLDIRYP